MWGTRTQTQTQSSILNYLGLVMHSDILDFELGLVTHSNKCVLGLDTDSDILDLENVTSTVESGHWRTQYIIVLKLLTLCCYMLSIVVDPCVGLFSSSHPAELLTNTARSRNMYVHSRL